MSRNEIFRHHIKNGCSRIQHPLCIILIIASLFTFQFMKLDSDPSPIKRFGDISDEGYWLHNARCKILFNSFLPDELSQAYVGAPLFTIFLYAAFKIFGISLISARVVPLLALWLTLIMVFFLVKKIYNLRQALFSVIFIGFMHEVLMYTKWATPIPLEILFLIAIFFFWELSINRNIFFLLLSGMAFSLAILSKLTALYFGFSLLLFIVSSYYIRTEIHRKKLIIFTIGFLLISIPFLLFFVIPNLDTYKFFFQTMGKDNVGDGYSLTGIILNLARVHINPIFRYPSVVILLIFTYFWIITFVLHIYRFGFKNALIKINRLELYSLCWLVGSLFILGISPDNRDRRFVTLIIPLSILSLSFMFNKMNLYFSDINRKLKLKIEYILFILFEIICAVFFFWMIQLVRTHWLKPVGIDMASYLLIGCIFFGIIAFFISYSFFIMKKKKYVTIILLSLFFSHNLVFNSIWYFGSTYTLRDQSRQINTVGKTKIPFTGMFAHQLAIENNTMPVWYLKKPMHINLINTTYFQNNKIKEFLLIQGETFQSNSFSNQIFNYHYLDKIDFIMHDIKPLTKIKSCPYPFTNRYRFTGTVYLITKTRRTNKTTEYDPFPK